MDERLRLPKECIDGFNLSASLCVKYHPAIAKHFRDMLENYSYKRQISIKYNGAFFSLLY